MLEYLRRTITRERGGSLRAANATDTGPSADDADDGRAARRVEPADWSSLGDEHVMRAYLGTEVV